MAEGQGNPRASGGKLRIAVRWAALLPMVVVGAVLVGTVVVCGLAPLGWLVAPRWTETERAAVILFVAGAVPAGAAGVWIAAALAPSHKRIAALCATGLAFLWPAASALAHVNVLSLDMDDPGVLESGIGLAVGAMIACDIIVWRLSGRRRPELSTDTEGSPGKAAGRGRRALPSWAFWTLVVLGTAVAGPGILYLFFALLFTLAF